MEKWHIYTSYQNTDYLPVKRDKLECPGFQVCFEKSFFKNFSWLVETEF